MAIVLPNSRKAAYLDAIVTGVGDNLTTVNVHLYTNDLAPDGGTSLGAFDEVTADFYESQECSADAAYLGDDDAAHVDYSPAEWEVDDATGLPVTVYGYYVTDLADAELLWSERRVEGPITISTIGQVYALYPTLALDTLDVA